MSLLSKAGFYIGDRSHRYEDIYTYIHLYLHICIYLPKICFYVVDQAVRKIFSEDIFNHNSAEFFSGKKRGFIKSISDMLCPVFMFPDFVFFFWVRAGEVCIGYCTGQMFNLTKRGD